MSAERSGSATAGEVEDELAEAAGAGGAAPPGYLSQKTPVIKRLRRIEGQVRGIERMVEAETYCIDVLTQVSAATRALQAVAVELVEQHLAHCVADAIERGGPDAEAKVKEAATAIARLVRS
jgi:DNA-binding FrmR family transcriptional regulator